MGLTVHAWHVQVQAGGCGVLPLGRSLVISNGAQGMLGRAPARCSPQCCPGYSPGKLSSPYPQVLHLKWHSAKVELLCVVPDELPLTGAGVHGWEGACVWAY